MAEDLPVRDRNPPIDPRFEPQLLWSDPWLLALAKPSGLLSRRQLWAIPCWGIRSTRTPAAQAVHR
ncbi:MAG: hypothetical protein ACKOPS_18575 [Cyanobium sp.]